MTGIYYYKLISPYADDVTKNCKLSINEIDSNFFNLKSADISAATYVRDEDSKGTLVLVKNNGDKIIVPIDTTIDKNIAYDFNASTELGDEGGQTLTITWKDDEGVAKSTKIENILTADNLIEIIGSDILTKVIVDNTLKGMGTMRSPLGIAGIEKTGMLAPAIKMIDVTSGGTLPSVAKYGSRFVTREIVNDYGYLYNFDSVEQIQGLLDKEFVEKEINKEVKNGKREYYWRVPTKADWDKLLNSIEPCEYQNHNSAACHRELGKLAGKFLKSECGWTYQEECACGGSRPYSACTTIPSTSGSIDDFDDYLHDGSDVIPSDAEIAPQGIDKYGMSILATGVGSRRHGAGFDGFKDTSIFWTTTHVHDDDSQDIYVKEFDYDRSGVWQSSECPRPYYSVRLVKDYDGSNYKAAEYIDGVLYRALLFPESKQVWLASNVANTKNASGDTIDYLVPNDGHISENRVEMFINEFNGRYWEKKVMNEGDTIVIQTPTADINPSETREICYTDESGVTQCIEVEIEGRLYRDSSYRVVYDVDEPCNKILVHTDILSFRRIVDAVVSLLLREKQERIDKDDMLQDEIDVLSSRTIALEEGLQEEISDRISADTEIWAAISASSEDIKDIWDALNEEISARTDADNVLSGSIDEVSDELLNEIVRATSTENEISGLTIDTSSVYTLSASASTENLILESKDGNADHFIKIKFDGNFGTITF